MTHAESNNDSWNEPPTEPVTLTASQMLEQARDAKGLSREEVAERLFLSATFIRYIDEGEFHKLPKPAFIKGYLRSYARAVDLDDDLVVTAYERDQNMTPSAPAIGHVTEETVGSGAFTGPVVQTGIVGLVLICVVGALVWRLSTGNDQTPPAAASNDSAVVSQTPSEALPKRVNPDQLRAETSDQPAESGGQMASAPASNAGEKAADNSGGAAATHAASGGEPSGASDTTPNATDVNVERKPDGNKQFITVRAGSGNDTMAFSFSGNCWVEITDGRGQKIYGDMNRAGDVMTVYGTGPFKVLLGKAPAVTMMWQGQQVDLTRYTNKDQTAVVRTARL